VRRTNLVRAASVNDTQVELPNDIANFRKNVTHDTAYARFLSSSVTEFRRKIYEAFLQSSLNELLVVPQLLHCIPKLAAPNDLDESFKLLLLAQSQSPNRSSSTTASATTFRRLG
jgi:hypothetical protein